MNLVFGQKIFLKNFFGEKPKILRMENFSLTTFCGLRFFAVFLENFLQI